MQITTRQLFVLSAIVSVLVTVALMYRKDPTVSEFATLCTIENRSSEFGSILLNRLHDDGIFAMLVDDSLRSSIEVELSTFTRAREILEEVVEERPNILFERKKDRIHVIVKDNEQNSGMSH